MKNLPNVLTVFRIILVPIFVWAFLGLGSLPIACGIYILAGATDLLDGYIARKYNLITKLGTVLDPLADKLLQLTATATLAISGLHFMWAVFGILLIKEVLMVIGGAVLYKKGVVMPAVWYGKVYSAYLFVVVLVVILWRDVLSRGVEIGLVASAIVIGILAGVGYWVKFNKLKE